jgi:hypothetical protein
VSGQQGIRKPNGQVVPRINEVIGAARATWGIAVTKRAVATATGLSATTITNLCSLRHPTLYDLRTLWRLCWFFNCGSGCLLQWIPPAGRAAADRTEIGVSVGPITLPRAIPARPPALRSLLPELLQGGTQAEIACATGLALNTVAAVRNRRNPPTRLAGSTLAALCDYLSEREGHVVGIAGLFVYEPPEPGTGSR